MEDTTIRASVPAANTSAAASELDRALYRKATANQLLQATLQPTLDRVQDRPPSSLRASITGGWPWSLAVVMAIFDIAVLPVPFRLMMQVLNALALGVSLSVVITCAPTWLRTLRKERLKEPGALSLGIGGVWCAEIGLRIWSIV